MNLKNNKNLFKYLHSYSHAIDLTFCLKELKQLKKIWEHIVIVPVCGEAVDCIESVFANLKSTACLVVLCINRPANHSKTNLWKSQNQHLVGRLLSLADSVIESNDRHKLLLNTNGLDCLLLDFNEHPFKENKGVGLARKIAADTALQLIVEGRVHQPWIFSTDADVELPFDYFDVIADKKDSISAFSLKFVHKGSDEAALMHQKQYDFKLYYYQQGVQIINKKYAYIPLGSTLVVEAIAYAKVRGFPARSGGEDFYILNKLAKIGEVSQPNSPVIHINIRYSDRVPFGTGPAINQLAQSQQQPDYYNPEVFFIISIWRQGLLAAFKQHESPQDAYGLNEFWQVDSVINKAEKQFKTEKQWYTFIDEWLDAFKILKSVHYLSEHFLPVKKKQLVDMKSYQRLTNLTNN